MTAMNGHTTPSSYVGRLEAFRKTDAERDALVAEVVRQYEELQLKYAEKCDDYNNEVESRRMVSKPMGRIVYYSLKPGLKTHVYSTSSILKTYADYVTYLF